jgi:hypothetical protein
MDQQARYLRQLRRLRRAARRWSVLTGTLAGTTVVLVPYAGLGWPDAIWAALTGGSAALTWWRWRDLRELASQPTPGPPDPAHAAAATRARIEGLIARLPVGQGALAELRRVQARARLRGSSVVPAWNRLDRAAQTLAGLAPRLDGSASGALREATVAERTLRDLGERTAAVERALSLAPADESGSGPGLAQAHAQLLARFSEGVSAYEQLVAAAASYVAQSGYLPPDGYRDEHGRLAADTASTGRLREATDLLHGIAAGLAELRTTG